MFGCEMLPTFWVPCARLKSGLMNKHIVKHSDQHVPSISHRPRPSHGQGRPQQPNKNGLLDFSCLVVRATVAMAYLASPM